MLWHGTPTRHGTGNDGQVAAYHDVASKSSVILRKRRGCGRCGKARMGVAECPSAEWVRSGRTRRLRPPERDGNGEPLRKIDHRHLPNASRRAITKGRLLVPTECEKRVAWRWMLWCNIWDIVAHHGRKASDTYRTWNDLAACLVVDATETRPRIVAAGAEAAYVPCASLSRPLASPLSLPPSRLPTSAWSEP